MQWEILVGNANEMINSFEMTTYDHIKKVKLIVAYSDRSVARIFSIFRPKLMRTVVTQGFVSIFVLKCK